MADRIQTTPRNKLLGLLADAFGGVYDYAQRPDPTMPMGLANPVLGLLADALPLRAGANVLDDLSYGQAPIRGTGMTTRLTPDATELAMAAAPFPKTSGKAALAALGAVDHGALNKAAIVWQGSPHIYDAEKLVRLPNGVQAYVGGKFNAIKDVPPGATVLQDFPLGRIRSEAIGTGEGAQAYGHGSYLAEARDVGKDYADVLASPRNRVYDGRGVYIQPSPMGNGKFMLAKESYTPARSSMVSDETQFIYGDKEFPNLASAIKFARQKGLLARDERPRLTAIGEDRQYIPVTKAADVAEPEYTQFIASDPGYLYKVDLPDNMIARMLDWDRPLSQQPEVVNNALKVFSDLQGFENYIPRGERAPVLVGRGISGDTRGRDLYRFLGQDTDSKDAASTLRGLGVPGIRYLDGGSRGVGAGTSNFVVFPGEENALTILERNGRGLLD